MLRSHARQLAELKLAAELEQARLMDEFNAQMELCRAEKEKEFSELRRTLLADAAEFERRAKERTDNDAKVQCYQLPHFIGIKLSVSKLKIKNNNMWLKHLQHFVNFIFHLYTLYCTECVRLSATVA